MTRLCSFDIQYNNQSYLTLARIRNSGNDLICSIHFIQGRLNFISPGDIVVYCNQEGIKQPHNIPDDLNKELQRCMCDLNVQQP